MRTVDRDDTPGLGRKIERPAPAPDTTPRQTGTPGIVRGSDGKLSTALPKPPPEPLPYIYIGNPTTWGTAIESLRKEAERQRGR